MGELRQKKRLHGTCVTTENSVRKVKAALRKDEPYGDFRCAIEIMRDVWWQCHEIAEGAELVAMSDEELQAELRTRELNVRSASSIILEIAAFVVSQQQGRPEFRPNWLITRKYLGLIRYFGEQTGMYEKEWKEVG